MSVRWCQSSPRRPRRGLRTSSPRSAAHHAYCTAAAAAAARVAHRCSAGSAAARAHLCCRPPPCMASYSSRCMRSPRSSRRRGASVRTGRTGAAAATPRARGARTDRRRTRSVVAARRRISGKVAEGENGGGGSTVRRPGPGGVRTSAARRMIDDVRMRLARSAASLIPARMSTVAIATVTSDPVGSSAQKTPKKRMSERRGPRGRIQRKICSASACSIRAPFGCEKARAPTRRRHRPNQHTSHRTICVDSARASLFSSFAASMMSEVPNAARIAT